MGTKKLSLQAILDAVITAEHLAEFLQLLEDLQHGVYAGTKNSVAYDRLPANYLTALKQTWTDQANEGPFPEGEASYPFFHLIEKQLRKIAPSTLTLAYQPTGAQLAEIVAALRTSLDPQLVVAVVSEPSLGAGFKLDHAGQQFDLSVSSQLTGAS